ncbi:lactaldehyde dehydrogenase/glycolaldehyde dehydrogenase [Litoreibacter meonggei]|uniref:Lactaldehyde dehydrogenase/glycolaldehyde dehydrogenase n=1 Tax=Litoreibacter meonggei TaxID=1049199 RepID=A0A497VSD8_9RHOB|nr:aldehyde dehydrogenase family protein [Litoreibacter meonggei]RLJ40979.1 lactaldehyde dehydrogenase/glycolaldehyde dehydrogenase [Litoreibacter meonggei]
MTAYKTFINGAWHEMKERERIEVTNPTDETVLGTIPDCTRDDVDVAVEAAKAAQPGWAALPPIERAKALRKLAGLIEENADHLARTLVLEQGKPLDQAHGEVGAAVNFLTYAAEHARRITGDIMPSDNPDEEILIRRLPRGVVVGLTAWNYPLALAARKLGPALIAGNTFILLSHEITPISGLELVRLSEQAGFPPGVFNVLTGRGPIVGDALVAHPDTDMITMTGSSRAGVEIYRNAANRLKFISLELGGKAPFIVMEDADVEKAAQAAVIARYTNCGQICTCAERIYLHRSIADAFTDRFVSLSKAITIGNPIDNPDMGPKVSGIEVEKVEAMIAAAIDAGAEPLLRGGPLTGGVHSKGHWLAPTVLSVTDNTSPIMQNEVFGPVAPLMQFDDFDEAVSLANASDFGLSAYLWTADTKRILRASRELKFGEVYINRANGEQVQGYHTGWGLSGTGGEDGAYGFDAYFKKQTTYLNWAT